MASDAGNAPAVDASRQAETYTTGEMARLSNNTLRTVRFYEEAGILHPIGRTEGGHRVFDRSELERLVWITDMRQAGVSLDEIRELLDMKRLAKSGGDAAKQATAALQRHIGDLRTKIEVLTRLCEDLEQTVDAASVCLTCSDRELFPKQCGACGRLTEKAPVPRGMRVLWEVPDPPAGGG